MFVILHLKLWLISPFFISLHTLKLVIFFFSSQTLYGSIKSLPGPSLAIQWLRLRTANAGGVGLSPGQGTRMPTLQSAAKKNWKEKSLSSQKLRWFPWCCYPAQRCPCIGCSGLGVYLPMSSSGPWTSVSTQCLISLCMARSQPIQSRHSGTVHRMGKFMNSPKSLSFVSMNLRQCNLHLLLYLSTAFL